MRKQSDPEEKMASIKPFGLRLKSELKNRLGQAAQLNGRSLNSEIVTRLELSFASEGASLSRVKALKKTAPDSGASDHETRMAALEAQLKNLRECVREAGIMVPEE